MNLDDKHMLSRQPLFLPTLEAASSTPTLNVLSPNKIVSVEKPINYVKKPTR